MSAPERPTMPLREFARQEGVDEKQVRRALENGRLQAGDDRRPFADQVGSGWHRPRRDSSKFAGNVRDNVRVSAAMSAPEPADVDPEHVIMRADAFADDVLAGRFKTLPEAIAVKENALALKHMLDARKRAGSLVDREAVQNACFKRARSERDAWLNWPSRVAPLAAADLGLEPDRVSEVLTALVHQQLVDLGDPELDLDGGDGDDPG